MKIKDAVELVSYLYNEYPKSEDHFIAQCLAVFHIGNVTDVDVIISNASNVQLWAGSLEEYQQYTFDEWYTINSDIIDAKCYDDEWANKALHNMLNMITIQAFCKGSDIENMPAISYLGEIYLVIHLP